VGVRRLDVFEKERRRITPCSVIPEFRDPHLGASTKGAEKVAVQIAHAIADALHDARLRSCGTERNAADTEEEVRPLCGLAEKLGHIAAQNRDGETEARDRFASGDIVTSDRADEGGVLKGILSHSQPGR